MKRILLLAALAVLIVTPTAHSQTTTFTYQGRLGDNGSPANGNYDLRFILFTADIGGSQVGPILTNAPVAVSNGLFAVTLDFGTNAFTGPPRFLEIGVRTNGSVAPHSILIPRQTVTPAPYAILAGNVTAGGIAAGTYSNAVTFNNAANSFSGSGGGLTTLNASQLTSGTVPAAALSNAWKTTGNAGTTAGVNFLGTTDNQPLELKANGQRALRLEPVFTVTNSGPGYSIIYSNAPNLIGGSPVNTADAGVIGSFIGGGGLGGYYVDIGAGYVFGGSLPNRVSAKIATIVGGYGNTIQTNADGSAIGGGTGNTIQTDASSGVIAGGSGNNISNAVAATIGGGNRNRIETIGNFTTIAGGVDNTIAADAPSATIGGGTDNTNRASFGTIGGGSRNLIGTNSSGATISGGGQNGADGQYASVPGGDKNSALGINSFAAGHRAKAANQGAFVWADSQDSDFTSTANNQFLIRAGGGVGIGSAVTPNGSLHLRSGGLAVTGASSPYSGVGSGVFIESGGTVGNIFAFDYTPFSPLPLVLNAPGGRVGIGRTPTANLFEVEGGASKTVAGSWLANSDARIKTDVHTVTHALEKLAQVRPVEFRYTVAYRVQHPSIEDRPYLNVIAQEFQQVFPEAVKSSGDKLPNGETILQVDTYPLTIYSAAAIQELNQKLETQVKQKDAKLAQLAQRLEAVERLLKMTAKTSTGDEP